MDKDILKNREAFLKAQQDIKDQIVEEIETILSQSLKEEVNMVNKSAKNVLNLDPNAKGAFQCSEVDPEDVINKAVQVIDNILNMTDVPSKMIMWEAQREYMEHYMIMVSTDMWDKLFADPDIGPTLKGYAKMPKEFYYDESKHRFVATTPKDPFNDANPL